MSTTTTRKGPGHRPGSLSGLRRVREDRGLTQVQLAELAGITGRQVQRLESGRFTSGATTATLADVLGADVRDLMTPEDER